jgi:hypothetical protein
VIRRFPIPAGETECPLRVGETYRRAIPRLVGRPTIRVLAIRTQRLRDISYSDALGEGFVGRRALPAFRRDWVRRHDRRWSHRLTASDAEIDLRWRQRWAARAVYVLEFDVVDPTRNLPEQRDVLSEVARRGAQRERAGRELDAGSEYVSTGGIDRDAEAVDPATVARITAGALERRVTARLSGQEQRLARRRARLGEIFNRPI